MRSRQTGFGLIEVMVTGLVLSIAVIGLSLMLGSVQVAALGQGDYRVALFLAEQKLEQLRAADFTTIATGSPAAEQIYVCKDGTISSGAQCAHPNEGPRFGRATCVRYVSNANPDVPSSVPPDCTVGSTTSSKRIRVTVTPQMEAAGPVTVEAVVSPLQVP